MIGQGEDLGEGNGASDGIPVIFGCVSVVLEKSVDGPPDLTLADKIVSQVQQPAYEEHGKENG